MKVINMGNIAEAYICNDLPTMGIVIAATLDELERLPNLAYKEVTISATPRRNCDVGTPDEQAARMRSFCAKNGVDSDGAFRCENCKLTKEFRCELTWAQMTYEEGGER